MTDNAFACLQRAVTLSRNENIQKLPQLLSRLRREKWAEEDISSAILAWSHYEKAKRA